MPEPIICFHLFISLFFLFFVNLILVSLCSHLQPRATKIGAIKQPKEVINTISIEIFVYPTWLLPIYLAATILLMKQNIPELGYCMCPAENNDLNDDSCEKKELKDLDSGGPSKTVPSRRSSMRRKAAEVQRDQVAQLVFCTMYLLDSSSSFCWAVNG